MKTPNILTLASLLFMINCNSTNALSAEVKQDLPGKHTFTVKTYDGLELPAQVIGSSNPDSKMILFINGSTPYDEKGHIGAFWTEQGKIVSQKHEFYLRFIEVMSDKGYSVATMAKRSFVYPTSLPRPNITDLALDIKYFVDELKKKGLLKDEKDLVIVGYSEGSVIAPKVLGMLKNQPHACVMLGSGNLGIDYRTKTIDDYYMTDVIRRLKNWDDNQIETEFDQQWKIQEALLNMTEDEFENEYKESKPFGFGFAAWESFYIDRAAPFCNPVPDLLYANIPVLICIGENDVAMPLTSARKVYQELHDNGLEVSFREIKDEVHQYEKYDVFPIIDTWLSSNFKSTSFTLQKADSLIINKYKAVNELSDLLSAVPYGGGHKEEIINCYNIATKVNMAEPYFWFDLGLKLYADHYIDKAYTSFSNSADSDFVLYFASLVWLGHLNDLQGNREEALVFYQKALDVYPGFPVQHDNWKMVIDTKWIQERLKVPFEGFE